MQVDKFKKHMNLSKFQNKNICEDDNLVKLMFTRGGMRPSEYQPDLSLVSPPVWSESGETGAAGRSHNAGGPGHQSEVAPRAMGAARSTQRGKGICA